MIANQTNHCYPNFLSPVTIKVSDRFTYKLNNPTAYEALKSDGSLNTEKKIHSWRNTTFSCKIQKKKKKKHWTASCWTGMMKTAAVGKGVTTQSKLGGDTASCNTVEWLLPSNIFVLFHTETETHCILTLT